MECNSVVDRYPGTALIVVFLTEYDVVCYFCYVKVEGLHRTFGWFSVCTRS